MKNAAAVLAVCALAACGNPSPPCPAGQTQCESTCTSLQTDAQNCGSCGNACGNGQSCVAAKCTTLTCDHPDMFAACWVGGGVTGVCSDTGIPTGTAVVALAPGDAGTVNGVVPQFSSAVFASSSRLWLLDEENNQIDIVDVSSWPPTAVFAIGAAPGDSAYSVTQLSACDGMILALRTATPVLEAYQPTTPYTLLGQVSLASDAGYQFPAAMACDGQQTVYVTDSANNTLTSVDLGTFTVTAQTTLPASDQLPPLPDGGVIMPYLTGVAVASSLTGGKVLVSLENLGPSYAPVADSSVFEVDPGLTTWSSPIDPVQCLNVFQIAISADHATAYLACAGIFDSAGATTVQPYNDAGALGVVTVAGGIAKPTVMTSLSNPASVALLKNGLVALGDFSPQSEVGFYNPVDGGIATVAVNCPVLPDGGLYPNQGVTAVVAAP